MSAALGVFIIAIAGEFTLLIYLRDRRGQGRGERGPASPISWSPRARRTRLLAASLDGSPHIEELFSEHLLQARDLYQKYAAAYAEQVAATIARVCRSKASRSKPA